ncbi:MAG TPA: glycosyltransferase family 8 protein [Azospirillaceae bacterium]|nr:glycosyltransferase family 8 protein [Azospirillaceae bacterium]
MNPTLLPGAGPSSGQIQVLFCCDTGFYQHAAVAMASLLENNARHRFDIHLITAGNDTTALTKLLASLKRFGNFTFTLHPFNLKSYSHFFTDRHISLEAYLRLFAPKVLDPTIDKVLYLDCDIVVTGDVGELWATNLGDKAVAGVWDPYVDTRRHVLGIAPGRPYINSGVLLFNLKAWRERGVTEKLIACIGARGRELAFHDQDALNIVLSDSIMLLDYRWNFHVWMFNLKLWQFRDQLPAIRRAARHPAILHFTCKEKPWIFESVVPRKYLYYQYLRQTEWRDYKAFDGDWRRLRRYLVNRLLDGMGIDYRFVRSLDGPKIQRGLRKLGQRLVSVVSGKGWSQPVRP